MASSSLSDIDDLVLKAAEDKHLKISDVVIRFEISNQEALQLIRKLHEKAELKKVPDPSDCRSFYFYRISLPENIKELVKRMITKQKKCNSLLKKFRKTDFSDDELGERLNQAEKEKEEIWKSLSGMVLNNGKTFAGMAISYPGLVPSMFVQKTHCSYHSPTPEEIISLYEESLKENSPS
ncbi:MAG: hypothetical protein ACFFD4_28005 [Candidatus Odinarchaeota archaeon]